MNWQTLLISCCNVQPQKLIMFLWYSSFFFFNFYFVLGCSQLAMLWSFQVNSEGTQSYRFVVVQSLSRVQLFGTPWTAALQASLSFTNSQSLLKLMSTESVMPSNHLLALNFEKTDPHASSQSFLLIQKQGHHSYLLIDPCLKCLCIK